LPDSHEDKTTMSSNTWFGGNSQVGTGKYLGCSGKIADQMYWEAEAKEAFETATALQWLDRGLALEWHTYALDCQRLARTLRSMTCAEYRRMCMAQAPVAVQASLF
jgi:hypothetical protein